MAATITAGEKRIRLATLLCEAAEIEHGLLCQYLFAAFSFKRDPSEGVSWENLEQMRGWQGSLLLVARQEMEHLGLVCNLLTAIGEAPYLHRPNFPLPGGEYPMQVESRLERFGLPALERFIRFEMPTESAGAEGELLQRALPGVRAGDHQTIAALYTEISELFGALDRSDLFIGSPSAQLVDTQNLRGVGVPGAGAYSVDLRAVDGLRSARRVIKQIITEGEGSPGGRTLSHFQRFCTMHIELREALRASPGFDPARPVIADPRGDGRTVDVPTARALDQFDLAYETLMLMLFRFFTVTATGAPDTAGDGLGRAAFFPMMTAVIRPLGEIVTQLPVSADGTETAGPRFAFDRPISLLPHADSAWSVIHGRLALLAARAERDAGDRRYPVPVRPRLRLLAQNLARIAADFQTATGASR